MALDEYQQAHKLLSNGKDILIIAGKRNLEDSYPAALGFKNYLDAHAKSATLFAAKDVPQALYFLQDPPPIQRTMPHARQLIISIDVSGKSVKQIRYKKIEDHLNIYVSPEDNSRISEQDVHVSMSGLDYDLIVALGVEDLTTLNSCFEENAQFFYETPIVNIDENSANERFGEVNIIDPLASSSSEIVVRLLKKWGEDAIAKIVATPLLAGIVSATNNFQNAHTKPSTLYEAAYLLSCDADRELVIKKLLKTKSFELLKLCGIAMAKLNFNSDLAFSWLTLSKDDFSQSGTNENDIPLVISELKNNFAHSSLLLVFWENEHALRAALHSPHEDKIRLLGMGINGERRGNTIFFDLQSQEPSECEKVVQEVSRKLKDFQVQ